METQFVGMPLTDSKVVAESGNVKTGPITVTNRSIATCPSTCPFLDAEKWEAKGCYGAGRLWAQVNGSTRDVAAEDLPVMSPVARDRVLGDITVPIPGDDRIDWEYVGAVQQWAARDDSVVFGYTHAAVQHEVSPRLWEQDYPNYVMNISCHTPEQVREVVDLGWPAVISTDDVQHGDMIGDKRVVECPAVLRDDVTCESCRLCARPASQRRYVILFRLHGVQTKKARAAVAAVAKAQDEQFRLRFSPLVELLVADLDARSNAGIKRACDAVREARNG